MLIRSIHVYHLLQDHQDLKKDHVLKKSAKLLCVPTVAFPQNLNGMQKKTFAAVKSTSTLVAHKI